MNGKGQVPTKIKEVLELATAFFLDRHSTTTSLSEFGTENMRNLKARVLGECDEIQTITDAADDDVGDLVFESLEYLDIHYMKNLRSIWKGPTWMGFSITSKSFGAGYMPSIDYHFYFQSGFKSPELRGACS